MVEARRQSLARVEAEREAMTLDSQRDLEGDLASYAAQTRQLERLRNERLPLARQKVDYQYASYRGGRVRDPPPCWRRGVSSPRPELRALDLEAARAAAAAKLYYTYGEGAR